MSDDYHGSTISPNEDWISFAEEISNHAWNYNRAPYLKFKLNGKVLNLEKIRAHDKAGVIYIDLIEKEQENERRIN